MDIVRTFDLCKTDKNELGRLKSYKMFPATENPQLLNFGLCGQNSTKNCKILNISGVQSKLLSGDVIIVLEQRSTQERYCYVVFNAYCSWNS